MDATQTIHYLYNNFYYDFIPDDSIPTGYQFNSDVIEYIIAKGADAINAYQTQRFGTIINAGVNRIADVIYSLMRNVAVTLGKVNNAFFDSNASIYTWHFECTGIDTDYEFSAEYGTAYGFKFVGICDEIFTLVLDQNGGFYGSEKIGNWTYSTDTTEIINQIAPQYDPDGIIVPTYQGMNFGDIREPFLVGKSLHFFIYPNNNDTTNYDEYIISDFTESLLIISTGTYHDYFYGFTVVPMIQHSFDVYKNGVIISQSGTGNYRNQYYHGYNGTYTGYIYNQSNSLGSFNYPYYISVPSSYYQNVYKMDNVIGILNQNTVAGNGDIWVQSYSTTPTGTPANPNPAPINVPIPVTEIPSNPEDPIPQNPTPDPVPGVPVTPIPIPLPPFASIVSGNDELWGETLGFEEAQDGLLPYMTSLSEFSFPSFTDLISDFSGSIIWVAQIMSILYNGTSFNVLFIALCLFSLVSILIGAYKLWATTEPDPNNPGFRRTKRLPKPPKGRRRR